MCKLSPFHVVHYAPFYKQQTCISFSLCFWSDRRGESVPLVWCTQTLLFQKKNFPFPPGKFQEGLKVYSSPWTKLMWNAYIRRHLCSVRRCVNIPYRHILENLEVQSFRMNHVCVGACTLYCNHSTERAKTIWASEYAAESYRITVFFHLTS